MGALALCRYASGMAVEITEEEAQRQLDLFRSAYPEIKRNPWTLIPVAQEN